MFVFLNGKLLIGLLVGSQLTHFNDWIAVNSNFPYNSQSYFKKIHNKILIVEIVLYNCQGLTQSWQLMGFIFAPSVYFQKYKI